ncbi:MAG: BamA/TamA family outer membrane protein [Polyangiaceae bacterium]|nr:BamA/TamA family outer membrane protein [Polyangiaceae bacterium]
MSVRGSVRLSSLRRFLVIAVFAAIALCGCYRIPAGKSAISNVEINDASSGRSMREEDDLHSHITTRESPRFLGLFYGVIYDYEYFDRYALRRDLSRIERFMQARGYYDAKAQVARVVPRGNKVEVEIEVDKGPPVVVDTVTINTLDAGGELDDNTKKRALQSIARLLRKGEPLDETSFAEAEKSVLRTMTSRGHASAKVARRAEVDLASHTARITFDIDAGPVARLGAVRFEGLGELPEDRIRNVFTLKEGDPYSSDEIDDARQALLDLGVFASVQIDADLSAMQTTQVVPLTVHTEPTRLKTILLGVGSELDNLRTDVHAVVGWQSANFFGGLRKFDIRFKVALDLYPTLLTPSDNTRKLLVEQRLSASLRQPAFLEGRTTGVMNADYGIFPVLLPDNKSPAVVGYHEARTSVGVERTFLNRLFVNPRYGVQADFPFDYIGRTTDVPALLISYAEIVAALDFRDDRIHTRRGIYLGVTTQFAGGPMQGNATDWRIQPEIRAYYPLARRVVLAGRSSVGFLFPQNYGSAATQNMRSPGSASISDLNRDYQLLYFRGFYAGGPVSNRGYPLRGIGPFAYIPYLSPAGQSTSAAGCNPNEPECLLPTGGLSLWEASAELRFAVSGPFSMAIFCDAADVSAFRTSLRFNRPHLSCGTGGRYDTPVGPIRLDIGYRIPGLQFPASATDEQQPSWLFDLAPIALSFGIGEAY